MSKKYSDTYLYSKYGDYEKKLFSFLMESEEIDKDSDLFADVKYEVKKQQVSNSLIKVLMSKNVILMIGKESLNKAFKVFMAKDIKRNKDMKCFIDCTDLIVKGKDGAYVCKNTDVLIAYLVSAMNTIIYYGDEKKITMNSSLCKAGAKCFSSLFTHVVDYLYKISTNSTLKAKSLYLSSLYYLCGILGKDFSDSTIAIAKQIAGISEREAEIYKLQIESNSFLNLKFFIETYSKSMRLDKITVDVITEKWMYLYGTGTVFGLELYPCFASMMTDTYVGCYINNQKSIEKVTGRNMVEFTKTILSVGAGMI